MHADRDKFFELEYNVSEDFWPTVTQINFSLLKAIEKSPQSDHEVALIPENRARNRFGNIFPCT